MTLNTHRFGYLDALRALAVAAILLYEIVEHAPGLLFPNPIGHRAAFAGVHGFEIFLVISGFVLAYPTLAALHAEGAASLDVWRFVAGRLMRVLPAYFAVLAATILLPYAAARYGLTAFGHPAILPPVQSIMTQAVFAQQHFGNDAFWALSVQMRTFLLFPILFAIYVRKPVLFYALAVVAGAADLYTTAHRFDVGAAPAFMLGIVAADCRVRFPVIARFGLPLAIAAFVGAFYLDPLVATLPGPRSSPGIENWNPLWTIGAFALVVGSGGLRWIERILSSCGLPQLGAAAFAIALVGEPVVAYIMRKATPTLGLPLAAANAFAVAIGLGIIVWLLVDRPFADPVQRRQTFERIVSFVRQLRSRLAVGPLNFETSLPAIEGGEGDRSVIEMPTFSQGDVAMLIKRSGTSDDLAAEIQAAAARFAERGSFDPFYFGPRPDDPGEVSAPQGEANTTIHYHLGPSSESA